jgi:hypothetical protein
MKPGILGIVTASMLIGTASMISSPADAEPSQPVVAPKKGTSPPSGRQKEEFQGPARKFSSEESRLPIPLEVPKAERVDPGK